MIAAANTITSGNGDEENGPHKSPYIAKEDQLLPATDAVDKSAAADLARETISDHPEYDFFLTVEPQDDAKSLYAGTNIDPICWKDFMEHLHDLVRNKLAEGEISTFEAARQAGITEEALFDYLNPQSESILGTYFLRFMNILHIEGEEIFPAFEQEDDIEFAMHSLFYYLSADSPISLKHLLEYSPGKSYRDYVQNLVIKKLRVHDSFNMDAILKNDAIFEEIDKRLSATGFKTENLLSEEDDYCFSDYLRNICQYGDFTDLIHDELLGSPGETIEFFQVLGITLEELIPTRQLSPFEREEINDRFKFENLEDDHSAQEESYSEHGSDYDCLADNFSEALIDRGHHFLEAEIGSEKELHDYLIILGNEGSIGNARGLAKYLLPFFPRLLFDTLPS